MAIVRAVELAAQLHVIPDCRSRERSPRLARQQAVSERHEFPSRFAVAFAIKTPSGLFTSHDAAPLPTVPFGSHGEPFAIRPDLDERRLHAQAHGS